MHSVNAFDPVYSQLIQVNAALIMRLFHALGRGDSLCT
jgi:hypothetical protein